MSASRLRVDRGGIEPLTGSSTGAASTTADRRPSAGNTVDLRGLEPLTS